MKRVTSALTTGAKFLSGQALSTFTLLHLDTTQKHTSGSVDTVVLPYIELGRSSTCVIQFSDDCATVSRRHAAIERRSSGEKVEFILKHLGANPTLINNQPVNSQWYLSNGDVIQLSLEGPRMRFNTNTVGGPNMKFTARLNLMRSQMAKQHRNELAIISSLFLIIALLGGFYIFKQRGQIKDLADQGKKIELQRQQDSLANEQKFQTTVAEMKQNKTQIQTLESQNKKLGSQIGNLRGQLNAAQAATRQQQASSQSEPMMRPAPANSSFVTDEVKNNVYFLRIIKFKLISPDGTANETDELNLSGTGYLLNDSRFVTSRHIVQFWRFITAEKSEENSAYLLLNAFENIGGEIYVTFEAISPNGDRFTFTNKDVFINDSKDEVIEISDSLKVKVAKSITSDWAVVNAKGRTRNTGLVYDRSLSANLEAGESVYVLGYTNGTDFQESNRLQPLYSESKVAQNGLVNGLINVTDRNFGPGNSGGPVFVSRNGVPTVVGIVAAMVGSSIGVIVPVKNIR